MLRRFICFGALLFIFMSFRGLSQNPVSRNYTVDDGLPSNEVYDIFEDSLGYLWFATDHGISRFDGYEFKNYSTNDGLTHNTIFGFFEDYRRRIWMRAFNSTVCYMEHGKIYPYAHNSTLQTFLGRDFMQTFAIDSVGDLWFMPIRDPHGLYHQDHRTGHIRKVPIKKGYNAFIRELGHGKFIAGVDFNDSSKTNDPEIIYDDHTWVFRAEFQPRHSNRKIVRVACKGKGHYLFSFEESLTEINNTAPLKKRSLETNATITCIYTDRKNQFWITGKELYAYKTDTLLPCFQRNDINSVRQDRQGNFWIATYIKGIFFIPNMNASVLAPKEGIQPHLIIAHNKQLIATTQSKKNLVLFPLSDSGPGDAEKSFSVNPLNIHDISIHKVREELFLGGGVFSTRNIQPKYIVGFERKTPESIGFIRSAFKFGKLLYHAGNSGWGIRNSEGETIYHSKQDQFTKFCVTICIDSTHRVWIGSTDGLYCYRNGHTELFRANDSLFRQNVTMVKCMPDGVVAASTRSRGIIFIDGRDSYNIRAANGLSTDLCGRLVVDGKVLWVCTNKGLNKITISRKHKKLSFEVLSLKTEHGLPSNLIYDATRYKDILIMATGKGLSWFNVKTFTLNNYTPPVYIDAVYANKRLIGKDSLLSYKETNLSFGFTGLLYSNAGKINYRYKLTGYESDWNYTTERSVRYFNLPAGHYSFIVEAMNENGLWSDKAGRYDFSIPMHFTKTWWFLLFLITCGLTILWLIIRYYLKQRRVQEQMNMNILMAELKTLRSQMKPHFVFNSLSSIQHFILDSDQESAHFYLSRFASLMRKILENASKDSISLSREVEMLILYLSLEKLRFGKEFEYQTIIDERLDPELIEIPPMLIQPYIENAIWHGLLPKKNQARLWIRFYPEEETTLVCEVEDNGIGRKAAAERQKSAHQSTGMKNIEERIGILNHMQNKHIHVSVTDLFDSSGTVSGTKVILKFSNTLIPKLAL